MSPRPHSHKKNVTSALVLYHAEQKLRFSPASKFNLLGRGNGRERKIKIKTGAGGGNWTERLAVRFEWLAAA